MLKGKNLWYVVDIGAVAYYFWWMNKKKKDAASAAPSTANAAFTGDLDVTQYQNANGDTTRKRVDTISGSSPFKHVVLKGNKPKQ